MPIDLLGLTVSGVGALMAGGWALLNHFLREIRQDLAGLRTVIDERFRLMEESRAQASEHWNQLYGELLRRSEQGLQRYDSLRDECAQLRLQLMECTLRQERLEQLVNKLQPHGHSTET